MRVLAGVAGFAQRHFRSIDQNSSAELRFNTIQQTAPLIRRPPLGFLRIKN